MATSGVKLLGAKPSPFVNRVVMTLTIKGIDYELAEMNPHEKPELLVKTNPVHKKVPVLIHGDRPVCESMIIVEYVDDAWTSRPPFFLPILATEPLLVSGCFYRRKGIVLHQVREVEEEARRSISEKISEALLFLEEAFLSCSKGRAFFLEEAL